jgi:enoyl-CoA hydratase
MDYKTLRVEAAPGTEAADGIRTLVLNRPEVMNAMNTQMFVELREALHELAFDDALRVLIVTGAGERAFSAGGDLKQRDGMTDGQWRRQHQLAEEVLLAVKDFPQPVIAAVEGHAHGGGCELALMCDYIVASRAAVFSLPELRRGIMPGGGGIQNLVRAVGMRRAKKAAAHRAPLLGRRSRRMGHGDRPGRAGCCAGRRRGRRARHRAGRADGGALRQAGRLARRRD